AAGLVVAVSVVTAASWFRADITRHSTARGTPKAFKPDKPDTFEDPSTGPLPVIQPGQQGPAEPLDSKRMVARAWRERRTLLLGLLVLGLALAEGAAGDWVALALADGHGQSDAAGAIGYGIFVTFMTVGRFAGTVVLDRFGRVPVMRWCSATAVVGLALFVFAPVPWLAFAALAIWGLGASLGFPGGHVRRRGRSGARSCPGIGRLDDRLRGLPLRSAALGLAGGALRHPAFLA
uniref:MFS transporter n=1 Tax=Arthrobacter sp. Hiyo1 TaxID=1588020 RepID=UPI000B1CF2A4